MLMDQENVPQDAHNIPTWSMGLGQYKWVANAGFAGLVAVLFAGLIIWGAHATTSQAVDAHKATNELYMEIARQAGEREKLHREEAIRMWQAIGENTKINLKTQELMADNNMINQKTQELLISLASSTKELAAEVKDIRKKEK